jgi:hypothetical protein
MMRPLPAWLTLAALAFAVTARADKPDPQSDRVKDETLLEERLLLQRFKDFKAAVLRVKQRLEKGSAEDREKARALQTALDEIDRRHLDTDFARLIKLLSDKSLRNIADVQEARQLSQKLSGAMGQLVSILKDDNRLARLRAGRIKLEEMIRELDGIIRDQGIVRVKTARKTSDMADMGKSQENVTGRTADLARKLKNAADDLAKPRRHIQAANQDQVAAGKHIAAGRRAPAHQSQGEALDKLKEARKALEELYRQAREEERERFLAALENRCRQMLEMQKMVLEGTVAVDRSVRSAREQKPTRTHHQQAGRLADKEKDIAREAGMAIDLIEQEGSDVAFAEVFRQVRTDMEDVQKRLEQTQVGRATQAIERDIISTLEEIIAALRRAREGGTIYCPPGPPDPGPQGPRPGPKMIDDVSELKMIRSLQVKLNQRTKLYAREYVGREGEQTSDAGLKDKLKELAERQDRLSKATMQIVKGDNQ